MESLLIFEFLREVQYLEFLKFIQSNERGDTPGLILMF